MANRRANPYNLAAAEAEARHPHTSPARIDGTTEELEAMAREQFAEERRRFVPGFAFSDLPARFIVPGKFTAERMEEFRRMGITPAEDGFTQSIYIRNLWRDPAEWSKVRQFLEDEMRFHDKDPKIPKIWNYSDIVKDAKPHRFDLANPRHYTLDGRMVPWASEPGNVARLYALHFHSALIDLFTTTAPNEQAAEVHAFLEHHRTKGDNPEALADHMEGMIERWKAEPPTLMDLRQMKSTLIPRHTILIRTMEHWLAEVRKAPTSGRPNNKANKKRPDLKRPTVADKLGEVPGAAERFIALVRGAGLCDTSGLWITGKDTRGSKAKLIAAWDAVVEVLKVPDFDTDAALVKALKVHFKGLEGLEALHKVRKRPVYTDHLEEYTAELFGK